jgi:O-antigen/teichoic acid export membrane protein
LDRASVDDKMAAQQRSAFSGLKADYLVAISASASIAVVGLVLYAWIGRSLDPESLGYFSQIRRVSGMWVPLASVGLALALGRYVPRLADPSLIRLRTIQALGVVAVVMFAHVLAWDPLLSGGVLQPVIGERSELASAFLWQLLGLGILVMPFALLRGLQRFRLAAVLQVTGYALWPLGVTFVCIDGPLEVLIERIGQGQVALALLSLLVLLIVPRPAIAPTESNHERFSGWLIYSSVRLPAGALGFVLWTGLPMILAQWGALEEAGVANAVTSLTNIPLLILSPLAFVLLPRLSLAQIEGQDQEVEDFLRRGLRSIWELQWPVTLTLVLFLEPLLELWLGFRLPSFTLAGLWMVVSIPAVSMFLFMRPALDARAIVPHAVTAQVAGLLVASGIVWQADQGRTVWMLGLAFFAAHTIAGIVAGILCFRIHQLKLVVPVGRVMIQTLPLALGAICALALDLNGLAFVVWLVAVMLHLVVLKRTESPVIAGVLNALERLKS